MDAIRSRLAMVEHGGTPQGSLSLPRHETARVRGCSSAAPGQSKWSNPRGPPAMLPINRQNIFKSRAQKWNCQNFFCAKVVFIPVFSVAFGVFQTCSSIVHHSNTLPIKFHASPTTPTTPASPVVKSNSKLSKCRSPKPMRYPSTELKDVDNV